MRKSIGFACFAGLFALVAACATGAQFPPEQATHAAVCELECKCTACSEDEIGTCDADAADAAELAKDRGCEAELETLSTCLVETSDCWDGVFETFCATQESKLTACLTGGGAGGGGAGGGGACAHKLNGLCDEPEGTGLCAEGTDVVDCAPEGCPYALNGVCDEPEGTGLCNEGGDPVDCAPVGCSYTNDGTCDEPEGTGLCPEGSDVLDCGAPTCPYTNDNECDEPEGTGLCPEGSDVADCAGGGGCATCYDAAFVGSDLPFCPGSQALYDAIVDCICVTSCESECAVFCTGGRPDDICSSCATSSCSSQFAACEADT